MIQYFRRTAGLLLLRLLSSFWIVKCAHQESEQLSDSWFPLIQQTFDKNAKFPLQKCHRRENIAPLSGQQCGGKRKTCFFGDHICGSGKLTYNYPTERCTCNGTRQKRGSWKCVPAPCGTRIQGTQCQDASIETHSWVDSFYDKCVDYEQFDLCDRVGDNKGVGTDLTANQACCTCGGGTHDPTISSQCTDLSVSLVIPEVWTDSVGDTCTWYAEDPKTRCIDFANEQNTNFGLSVGEACCACVDVSVSVPDSMAPTCIDLPGWVTADDRTCSQMTKSDCQTRQFENFGFTPDQVCCKCGRGGSKNRKIPSGFTVRTMPYTAGLCSSDSSKFNICFKVGPNIHPKDVLFVGNAESIWSSVIIADIPELSYAQRSSYFNSVGNVLPKNAIDLIPLYRQFCGFDPGFAANATTDDLNICLGQADLGSSKLLAYAAPIFGDNFTRFGFVTLNANAIRGLREFSVLGDVILHEIGHILGIGSLWDSNITGTLLRGTSDSCSYLGDNANRVYQELSGCPTDVSVPLDRVVGSLLGSTLTCGYHLDEGCFGAELMSPYLRGKTSRLSSISVALLEDLGYTVDYSKADPYGRSNLNPACVCAGGGLSGEGRLLEPGNQPDPIAERTLSKEGEDDMQKSAKKKMEELHQAGATAIPGLMVMYMEEKRIYSRFVENPN